MEFDLLFDPEECWGLVLVVSVETMKSVGWRTRRLGFLLPDSSPWERLYMVFKQERDNPIRQGEGARVAGCFQGEVGVVTKIANCQ